MSVHKTGTGYRVRYRDAAGVNRSRGPFSSKRAAESYDALVKEARITGQLARLDAGKRTLANYFDEVFWPIVTSKAPATQILYENLWDLHIAAYLGATELRSLGTAQIREWLAARDRDGAGREALRKSHTLLGTILQHAFEDEEIRENPARRIRKLPAKRKPAVRPLPPQAIERVRQELPKRDATLVSVLAYAGLRPGEALALQRRDVSGGLIHVERAIDGIGDVKGTKTLATRTVRPLAPVVTDLNSWLEHVAAGPEALLFPTANGQVFTRDDYGNWSSRRWRRGYRAAVLRAARAAGFKALTDDGAHAAVRAAGLDPVETPNPYACRHSSASLLAAAGRTVFDIAAQLGHDPRLTLSTYGHLIEQYAGKTIDPEAEIRTAREQVRSLSVPSDDQGEDA